MVRIGCAILITEGILGISEIIFYYTGFTQGIFDNQQPLTPVFGDIDVKFTFGWFIFGLSVLLFAKIIRQGIDLKVDS